MKIRYIEISEKEIRDTVRVLVPKLARSFGIFFTVDETKSRENFGAKIIPLRGIRVEFESDSNDVIYVKLDRKRKIAVTSLLRAFGAGESDKELLDLFKDEEVKKSIINSLKKDPAKNANESFVEIYKRLRDDKADPEDAKNYIENVFSNERYDLSEIGRIRFNKRFSKKEVLDYSHSDQDKLISLDDIKTIIENIVFLNSKP